MVKTTNSEVKKDIEIIDLTPGNVADYGVCGYKDVKKHLELLRKIEWFNEYYPKGFTYQGAFFKILRLIRV
jgi:hypothetical protein